MGCLSEEGDELEEAMKEYDTEAYDAMCTQSFCGFIVDGIVVWWEGNILVEEPPSSGT